MTNPSKSMQNIENGWRKAWTCDRTSALRKLYWHQTLCNFKFLRLIVQKHSAILSFSDSLFKTFSFPVRIYIQMSMETKVISDSMTSQRRKFNKFYLLLRNVSKVTKVISDNVTSQRQKHDNFYTPAIS